jgi:hypothetical protein
VVDSPARIEQERVVRPVLFGEAHSLSVVDEHVEVGARLARRIDRLVGEVDGASGVRVGARAAVRCRRRARLGETFAAGMARHRAGAKATVARLAELGALRAELPPEDAAAVLAALTAPSLYASLTGEHGWTFDRCQAWLNHTLGSQLLAKPRRR